MSRRIWKIAAVGALAAAALQPLAGTASAQEGERPPGPTAPPTPTGPGIPAAGPAGGTATGAVDGDRRHVSLNLKGSPLADVLRTLGDLYDLNLILPKDVAGNVTLILKDVPIEDALEAIVSQHDYAILPSGPGGSILKIVPKAQMQQALSPSDRIIREAGATTENAQINILRAAEIRLFDVKHARGEDLVALIQPLITPKGIGYVAFNQTTKKLIVRDLPENLNKIGEMIGKVDVTSSDEAAQAQAQLPVAIKVVRLRYVESSSLVKVIEKLAKAEQVEWEEERSTKSYVLRGFPERIAAVERMIHTLDQRTPQVRIKVRIVETTLGNDEKLGINWTMRLRANGSSRPWAFPFTAHSPASWVFFPTPNPTSSAGGSGGGTGQQQLAGFAPGDSMPQVLSSQFTFGILDASQFSALLEAIAIDTGSDLVAAPQVTTLDNRQAVINLGTRLPVPIFQNIVNQQTGVSIVQVTGFEQVETGTTLKVTPRVGGDDFITLDVAPEISEITGFVGQNQERPILAQRRMSTSVVLRSGSTLVLGGLNQSKTTETVNRVPFLGSIPLLGLLFTHKAQTIAKTDLLIFITPEMVQDEPQMVERQQVEKDKRERGLVKVGERWVSANLVDQVNRLAQRLRSDAPMARRDALVEVGQLVDAERSELLKRADVLSNVLRGDSDVDVKRAAAEILGGIDPPRLASELASLPGSTPLQAIGEVLVPMALRTPSRSIRNLILANAIRVDRASTVTALMAAVAFGKAYERLAACEGLALAGDPAAAHVLDEAIREGRPAIAPAAADALGAAGGPQPVGVLLDALSQRPAPHLELHLAAALAEAIGDDARLTKELAAQGITLTRRVQDLLIRERRDRRPRFDRILKAYAAPETADGPEVTGPPESVRKVKDALQILLEGSPGHRHLVTVALRGIDVIAPPAPREAPRLPPGAPGAAIPPPAPVPAAPHVVERVENGRLKLSAASVEMTPAIHLAHDLVYHSALADVLAAPLETKAGAGADRPPAATGVLGPIGHRAEQAALREQWLAIQAIAGRIEFRDVDGAPPSIEEALQARDLWPAPRPQGR